MPPLVQLPASVPAHDGRRPSGVRPREQVRGALWAAVLQPEEAAGDTERFRDAGEAAHTPPQVPPAPLRPPPGRVWRASTPHEVQSGVRRAISQVCSGPAMDLLACLHLWVAASPKP